MGLHSFVLPEFLIYCLFHLKFQKQDYCRKMSEPQAAGDQGENKEASGLQVFSASIAAELPEPYPAAIAAAIEQNPDIVSQGVQEENHLFQQLHDQI